MVAIVEAAASATTFYCTIAVIGGAFLVMIGFLTVDVNPAWTRKVSATGAALVAVGTAFPSGSMLKCYVKEHWLAVLVSTVAVMALITALGATLVILSKKSFKECLRHIVDNHRDTGDGEGDGGP